MKAYIIEFKSTDPDDHLYLKHNYFSGTEVDRVFPVTFLVYAAWMVDSLPAAESAVRKLKETGRESFVCEIEISDPRPVELPVRS